jgi:hypothetical protein
MTRRTRGRVGAAGLAVCVGVAVAPAPAHAADVDLGAEIRGTTIARNSPGKTATVTLTSHGTTAPGPIRLRVDASGLDTDRVRLAVEDCPLSDGVGECVVRPHYVPYHGGSWQVEMPLTKVAGAQPGDAGGITVTVLTGGDTDSGNNTDTAEVTLSDRSGPDLAVYAGDAGGRIENGIMQPIGPDQFGSAGATLINYGDQVVTSHRSTFVLPPNLIDPQMGATAECEYSAPPQTLTCTEAIVIAPDDGDDFHPGSGSFDVLNTRGEYGIQGGGQVSVTPLASIPPSGDDADDRSGSAEAVPGGAEAGVGSSEAVPGGGRCGQRGGRPRWCRGG